VPARPWNTIEESDDEMLDEDDVDDNDKSVEKVSAEHQAFVDAQFDKTIEEYADSEIGDLEEVSIPLLQSYTLINTAYVKDDEETAGHIDFESSNPAFDDAIEEFLRVSLLPLISRSVGLI
jgi:hypothetical protein